MQLQDLIKPLNQLSDECFFDKELKDYLYLFENFADHFDLYVTRRDADSFTLLTLDEIACLERFPERNDFLRESLMVFIDVMEAVKIDHLNYDNNEEENARIESLISSSIEEIRNLTHQDARDNEDINYKN